MVGRASSAVQVANEAAKTDLCHEGAPSLAGFEPRRLAARTGLHRGDFSRRDADVPILSGLAAIASRTIRGCSHCSGKFPAFGRKCTKPKKRAATGPHPSRPRIGANWLACSARAAYLKSPEWKGRRVGTRHPGAASPLIKTANSINGARHRPLAPRAGGFPRQRLRAALTALMPPQTGFALGLS